MPKMARSLKSKQTAADNPIGFLSLAAELRNRVYEFSLTQEGEITPWSDGPREVTRGLLCACKTVYREASPVFYGRNRFNFCMATPEQVGRFLERIGKSNASYIRHMTIDFTDILGLDHWNFSDRKSVCILETIRGPCTNLSTIRIIFLSGYNSEDKLEDLEDFKFAPEALAQMDARFRSIESVQGIIVELWGHAPSDLRNIIESHGWSIERVGHEGEGDGDKDISDLNSDGDAYQSGSDGDDYDIDT